MTHAAAIGPASGGAPSSRGVHRRDLVDCRSVAAVSTAIDTTSLDPAVRPADDLFRHVNGRWLARAEIPADRAIAGSFTDLRDDAERAVR